MRDEEAAVHVVLDAVERVHDDPHEDVQHEERPHDHEHEEVHRGGGAVVPPVVPRPVVEVHGVERRVHDPVGPALEGGDLQTRAPVGAAPKSSNNRKKTAGGRRPLRDGWRRTEREARRRWRGRARHECVMQQF